jgi:copper chaperone CopZ
MKKVVLLVADMHCVNCAMRLQELEDLLPGVVAVDASYHKGKMTVTFDEARVTLDQLIQETRKLGYSATEDYSI